MDHPLIDRTQKALRKRVIDLLREGYSVRRRGNIIFVCGGNEPEHMRTRFREHCKSHLQEFELFLPEFAMKHYFSEADTEPFDIAEFEEMIGELSHAIVLFPEAPGSYAEAGYFSVTQALAAKTIIALDAKWQDSDSFISLGPVRKFNTLSNFSAAMQIPYAAPDFDAIIKRINRIHSSATWKSLKLTKFKDLSKYEKFCLIQQCFKLLIIATLDDVMFILAGIFENHFSRSEVRKLTSILVGAEYLREVSAYGHYRPNPEKPELLKIRERCSSEEASIRLEIAAINKSNDRDFSAIIDGLSHVA